MSSPMPTKLAELIGRLEKALGESPDRDELFQMESGVEDVIEDLRNVGRPIISRDKTGSRSIEPPNFAFGPTAAGKATSAINDAAAMKSAVNRQDWQNALASARKIQTTMS